MDLHEAHARRAWRGTLPAGTSLANLNFDRAHAATIKALDNETKRADCDDAED